MGKLLEAEWTTGSPSAVKTQSSICHCEQHKNMTILTKLSANGQVPYSRWLETQRARDSDWISEQWLTAECCLFFQTDLQRILRWQIGNHKH